jgi:hypothetical protein
MLESGQHLGVIWTRELRSLSDHDPGSNNSGQYWYSIVKRSLKLTLTPHPGAASSTTSASSSSSSSSSSLSSSSSSSSSSVIRLPQGSDRHILRLSTKGVNNNNNNNGGGSDNNGGGGGHRRQALSHATSPSRPSHCLINYSQNNGFMRNKHRIEVEHEKNVMRTPRSTQQHHHHHEDEDDDDIYDDDDNYGDDGGDGENDGSVFQDDSVNTMIDENVAVYHGPTSLKFGVDDLCYICAMVYMCVYLYLYKLLFVCSAWVLRCICVFLCSPLEFITLCCLFFTFFSFFS